MVNQDSYFIFQKQCGSSHRDMFSGLCVQTLEPSARVPVCSCGAVNQTNPAKREQAQAPGQEIALENTPLWQRINSVLIGEKAWWEGGKKGH